MVKNPTVNTGDVGLIPGLGRSHGGGGNGNPLQYSCLKNPMDREAWWSTVQRVSKSQMRQRTDRGLSTIRKQNEIYLDWYL